MDISIDVDGIIDGLTRIDEKTKKALALYGDVVAKKAEAEAKSGARWTDRTGSARQRLRGESSESGNNSVRVTLSHNVDYGIYLEYCHGGKNAIVEPTIDNISGEAIKGMENLIK